MSVAYAASPAISAIAIAIGKLSSLGTYVLTVARVCCVVRDAATVIGVVASCGALSQGFTKVLALNLVVEVTVGVLVDTASAIPNVPVGVVVDGLCGTVLGVTSPKATDPPLTHISDCARRITCTSSV